MPRKHQPDKPLYIPPALRTPRNSTSSLRDTSSNDCKPAQSSFSSPSSAPSLHDLEYSLQSLTLSDTQPANRSRNLTPASIAVDAGDKTEHEKTTPKIDYTKFQHVIELYDFTTAIDTSQIEEELSDFAENGFCLKWVDDTHCIAVFSMASDAKRAISQLSGRLLKARRLEKASVQSKWKLLRSPGDWSLPYKRRPATSSVTAHRLISHHLGISSQTSPASDHDSEVADRRRRDQLALVEARTRHRESRKAQKAIWEDEAYEFK